jgi:sulfonate transport system substrate-binding protein
MKWMIVAIACMAPITAVAVEPLTLFGRDSVLEMAPVLIAANDGQIPVVIHNGGVPDLWSGVTSEAKDQVRIGADLAANAETQVLRMSVKHPDVRIIMIVAEGLYEVIARRSAGIATIADLKGKRIATFNATSAAYFLRETLASAGLSENEVTIDSYMPGDASQAFIEGRADALVIWEPEAERARKALGADAVRFVDPNGYRELYGLSARQETLEEPRKRSQIVAFLRQVKAGCFKATHSPARVQKMLSKRTGIAKKLIASSWKHHRFPCSLPTDLVDVMVREDAWLAASEGRNPRSRAQLSRLIDGSLLEEAFQLPQ